MAYSPIPVQALVPGYPGNGVYWGALLSNVDDAYTAFGPQIIGGCVKWAMDSTTQALMGEWLIPRDADNARLAVDLWWRGTTGHTATATFEVSDGFDSDYDAITNTSSSWSHATITVTPVSTSGHPRWGRVYLESSSAGQVAAIAAMACYYSPASYPDGLLASGAAKVAAWSTADRAVPSRVVARAANNIRAIARDRSCGIAGGMHRTGTVTPAPAGPDYEVTGSAWQLVERFVTPYHDPGRRLYRLGVKAAGTAPEWRFVVGGHLWEGSGTGWSYDQPELALPEGATGSLYLRSTSGGICHIDTWQLLREVP